jgi:hypothetical protein
MSAIVRETEKMGNRSGRVTLVWWIPPEFWQAALTAAGTIPADKVKEMVRTISDVNVVAVVDGPHAPARAPCGASPQCF